MERSTIPPLGDIAFQLDAHWLLTQAGGAPDEDTRDAVEEFAHDLATIQNLPSSKDVPEQIAPPVTFLDLLTGAAPHVQLSNITEDTDGQD